MCTSCERRIGRRREPGGRRELMLPMADERAALAVVQPSHRASLSHVRGTYHDKKPALVGEIDLTSLDLDAPTMRRSTRTRPEKA